MSDKDLMTVAEFRDQITVAQELAKTRQAFVVMPVMNRGQLIEAATLSLARFEQLEKLATEAENK